MFALILAGGKGERLRPLTDTLPKPMAPLAGKPLLEHQVRWLRSAGVSEVVFLAGYRWQQVRDYFGDGDGFGIRSITASRIRRWAGAGLSAKAWLKFPKRRMRSLS